MSQPRETVAPKDGTVGRTDFTFESADGKSAVRAVLWIPAALKRAHAGADGATLGCFKPRGVVQLIHGMAEHIDRYDDFARFLAGEGYLVAGHDHIGHGWTAAADNLGMVDAETGADAMIEDANMLRTLVTAQVVAGTPYFVFGHSMGSLVLRNYLPRFGEGLAGAVICGTANQPEVVAAAGNVLARAIAKVRGADYKSKLLHSLADGAYSRAVKDARTPFDWLSRDPAVADAFMADERAGFMFSAGAYATLTALAARANSPAAYRATPHDLPLLFVAGDADPVGDCGRGVAKAAESMERAGAENVTLRLFPGMRHEILNELGKEEVYEYILSWINLYN
ncbi:alpha/beta hydrolase [Adlercreutzia sp. R25]|uniref:alpha/beta hydrolase n=1 Tax=Adlercreutzia shanghongiae TaxID=3111773 RepID=UPI002DBE076E|nr:alpha/beta hydrolase [Adlercreutzia sp. R25]MEC4273254.1 alpha/beta hydrolase [Adlercreutzia sp. R25]